MPSAGICSTGLPIMAVSTALDCERSPSLWSTVAKQMTLWRYRNYLMCWHPCPAVVARTTMTRDQGWASRVSCAMQDACCELSMLRSRLKPSRARLTSPRPLLAPLLSYLGNQTAEVWDLQARRRCLQRSMTLSFKADLCHLQSTMLRHLLAVSALQ